MLGPLSVSGSKPCEAFGSRRVLKRPAACFTMAGAQTSSPLSLPTRNLEKEPETKEEVDARTKGLTRRQRLELVVQIAEKRANERRPRSTCMRRPPKKLAQQQVATGSPPLLTIASRCEQACVKDRSGYAVLAGMFLRWLSAQGAQEPTSVEELQNSLILIYDDMANAGLEAYEASMLYAAVVDKFPWATGPVMPRSQRALRGYRKLRPLASRAPLPIEAMGAIVAVIVAMGWGLGNAIGIALALYAYLRPGSVASIKRKQLLDPVRKSGPAGVFALVLAPPAKAGEKQLLTKTGTIDETILLDKPSWFTPVMTALVAGMAPEQLVFPEGGETTTRLFNECCHMLGLPARTCRYQLRHGGTSHDLLHKVRPKDEVTTRGLWRSDSSVKRYGKPASVRRLLLEMSEEARKLVEEALGSMEPLLLG